MKRRIISCSIIGTILTGNVVKATTAEISKVIDLSVPTNNVYQLTPESSINVSTDKTSSAIIGKLKSVKINNTESELSTKGVKEGVYFISAVKEATDAVTNFVEYDEKGLAVNKKYEIYVDKIIEVKKESVKINGVELSNDVSNFNSYKVRQFLGSDGKSENELLEIFKKVDATKFNGITIENVYIESYKLDSSAEVKLNGKDFDKGIDIINTILKGKKVEIVTKQLKDKIIISIEDENKLDESKFTSGKLDEIKNYLKYLSNGRHSKANPANYDVLSTAIKGFDNNLNDTTLQIKVDTENFGDLSGADKGFTLGKTYKIKFAPEFYQQTPPNPTTTLITVKFVPKDGFELNNLDEQKTIPVDNSNLTVEGLITAINTEIADLGLTIGDNNFTINIDGINGTVTNNTVVSNDKTVTIIINKENSKYIKKKEEKSDPVKNGEQSKKENEENKSARKPCCKCN